MGRYEQQRGFLKSNFLEFKHVKTDKIKRFAPTHDREALFPFLRHD